MDLNCINERDLAALLTIVTTACQDEVTSEIICEQIDIGDAELERLAGLAHKALNSGPMYVLESNSLMQLGSPSFWSAESGWGKPENATLFTREETEAIRLPLRGRWALLNETKEDAPGSPGGKRPRGTN